MNRISMKSLSKRAAIVLGAAALVTVLGVTPAYAGGTPPGGGGEGGLELASSSVVAICDGDVQKVKVDATFVFYGSAPAGVIVNGASAYQVDLNSGQIGQASLSTVLSLPDGSYTIGIWAASPENVLNTVNISLPSAEGCGPKPPLPPAIMSVTQSASCVDNVPTGVVNANVALPEGNEPATISASLNGAPFGDQQTVTASGSFSFSGPVSVGENNVTLVLNGINVSSAKVVADACVAPTNPPVTPPTTTPTTPQQPAAPVVKTPVKTKSSAPIVNSDLPSANTSSEDSVEASVTQGMNPLGVVGIGGAALLIIFAAGYFIINSRRSARDGA